jgi:tellurite resistance protein
VFLFFYGLERRLIVDDKSINERNEIIEEILRLLELYGSNSSFYSYAQALLSLHWVLYGNRNEIPKYLTLENRRVSFPVQAQIGALINQGKPIPSDWAVKWLRLHPTTYLGTPSRRCYLEFNELFSKKYELKFGTGLQIKPNKTKLVFSYHPASPTIQSVSIPCDIPDIFALTKPITQLQEIAKECEDELSSYSRVLGKSETDKSQLPILATLPKPLFDTHPKTRSIKNIIEQKQQSDFSIITTLELLTELDHSSISSISKREAEHIAQLFAKLGYLIAPDIKFHNAKPDLNGNIVLIKSDDAINFSASENYNSIALHTRLSALVSQIDGEVSISEERIILKNIQSQNHLTEAEKKSLSSFAVWCLKNPQSNVGIKQRLTSATIEEKAQIAKLVVSIAQADGNIAIQEIKQIEKLYTMIGLERQQLLSDLHQQTSSDDPIIVSDGTEETIYSLPKKPKQETTGFSIDHQKIQRLEEETRKVQSVLQTVFMEDELGQLEVTPMITPNNPVDNLTPVYKQLLESLIEHQTWTIQDYEQLCSDLKLMPNGAIEVLNDWSYNFANAPILEDGDPIFVDIDLYKEITND